eukprot:g2174.t1
MPMGRVRDMVLSMYEKKIKADKADDEEGNARDSLSDFVDDFFEHSFGIPKLAKEKNTIFHDSVLHHCKSDRRIAWFAVFSGWLEDEAFAVPEDADVLSLPYLPHAINIFLQVVRAIFSDHNLIDEKMGAKECPVRLSAVSTVLEDIFRGHTEHPDFHVLKRSLRKNSRHSAEGVGKHRHKVVEAELALDLICTAWFARELGKGWEQQEEEEEATVEVVKEPAKRASGPSFPIWFEWPIQPDSTTSSSAALTSKKNNKKNIVVTCHIADRMFEVNCGEGEQTLKWLALTSVKRLTGRQAGRMRCREKSHEKRMVRSAVGGQSRGNFMPTRLGIRHQSQRTETTMHVHKVKKAFDARTYMQHHVSSQTAFAQS